MRKIKFRGMTVDGEKHFVYGLVSRLDLKCAAIYDALQDGVIEVEPETVGQYTGMNDDSGKEIYEGDIVAFEDGERFVSDVIFDDCQYMVFFNGGYRGLQDVSENFRNLAVIGNIHENPGLLEECD